MSDLEDLITKGLGSFDREDSGVADGSDRPGESRNWSKNDDRRFELLLREYSRSNEYQNRQFDQVLRVAAIGFSAAGALFFLVVNETLPFGEWIFWVAPLLLTLLYSIAIFLTYSMVFNGYYIRELEDDLARMGGVEYLHFSNTFARGMSSFRTGYAPMLATTILFVLFAGGIYLAMVVLGFVQLRKADVPVWREAAFILLHISLTLTLVWSALGIWTNLRATYDKWRTVSAAKGRSERDKLASARSIAFAVIAYAILPRPVDFVLKSLFTIGALVITALILDIPFTTKLVSIGFLTVLCIEYLAKQATYIWNEILDAPLDRAHPYKSQRLLCRIDNISIGKRLFLTRAGAAVVLSLILAAEFGLRWLPPLVGIIFVWQWCYDRWAKRGPVRRLVLASAGYAQRAAAGSLAAMSAVSSFNPLFVVTLSGWFIICMAMVLAEFWWAERKALWEKAHGPGSAEKAPSQIWFLKSAPRIEAAANVALIAAGLVLALMYGDSRTNRPARATAWLSETWSSLKTSIWSLLGDVFLFIGELREFELFGRETSSIRLTFSVVLFTIVGAALVLFVRSRVTQENRTRWTGWLFLILLTAVILFSASWLSVVALIFPLILAANFRQLSFEEIQSFESRIKKTPALVLTILDHLLFQPWAVRISIRPRVVEGASSEVQREADSWAAALHEMYLRWGTKSGLTPRVFKGKDGGGTHDLLLCGRARYWSRLPTEAGFHELILDQVGSGTRHIAQVIIQPLGVAANPETGNGVDVPLDVAAPTVSHHNNCTSLKWRQYFCVADGGTYECGDVVEPLTGWRSLSPERALQDGPALPLAGPPWH